MQRCLSLTMLRVSYCLILASLSIGSVELKAPVPVVGVRGLTPQDKQTTQDVHNRFRTLVTNAANMQKMTWSSELALIAQNHAEQCTSQPNYNRSKESSTFSYVGENLFTATEAVSYFDIVSTWYSEYRDYEYSLDTCSGVCEHYKQMVWATSSSIGCGAYSCSSSNTPPHFIFLCNYGPGGNVIGELPYIEGPRCSKCQKEQHCDMGLCAYSTTDYSTDSSPQHFIVQLSDGHLLCHTIQGENNNTVYNLISTNMLEINAMVIPDPQGRKSSWIGVIGMTAQSQDGSQRKPTQIKFRIKEHLVEISDKISLDAYSVEKLTINSGKLILLPMVGKVNATRGANVRVEFRDLDLNFTVRFVRHHHLDVFWDSAGMSEDMDGLIGQFLQKGVKIDEPRELLILPGKEAVPVKQRSLWSFMERGGKGEREEEHTCWATLHPSNQGRGILTGSYLDYKVEDIFSAGLTQPPLNMATNHTVK